jgi:hypothetical protein
MPSGKWRQKSAKRRREYLRSQRIEVDGVLVHPDAPHGTRGGYEQYGCHCLPCMDGYRVRKWYQDHKVLAMERLGVDLNYWTPIGRERCEELEAALNAPTGQPSECWHPGKERQ